MGFICTEIDQNESNFDHFDGSRMFKNADFDSKVSEMGYQSRKESQGLNWTCIPANLYEEKFGRLQNYD